MHTTTVQYCDKNHVQFHVQRAAGKKKHLTRKENIIQHTSLEKTNAPCALRVKTFIPIPNHPPFPPQDSNGPPPPPKVKMRTAGVLVV